MTSLIIKSLTCKPFYLQSSKLLGIPQNSKTCLQNVRGYRPRKPFWLGRAKSKMFRFHIPPVIQEEEHAEILRLYEVYRTNMQSLREYFNEQIRAQTTGPEVLEERKEKAREHYANCFKENDLWNAKVAKIREARMAKEALARDKKIAAQVEEYERNQREFIEKFDEQVRREKEASKTFITPDNIEEAIELALSSLVDHNFCIDLEGNKYEGRYGKPTPKKKVAPITLPNQDPEASVEARN